MLVLPLSRVIILLLSTSSVVLASSSSSVLLASAIWRDVGCHTSTATANHEATSHVQHQRRLHYENVNYCTTAATAMFSIRGGSSAKKSSDKIIDKDPGPVTTQKQTSTKTKKLKKKINDKMENNSETQKSKTKSNSPPSSPADPLVSTTQDPLVGVAQFLAQRLDAARSRNDSVDNNSLTDTSTKFRKLPHTILAALHTLSLAQQAFKGLDGVAHEAYQRSNVKQKRTIVTTSVRGRAQRSARRTTATATALEACELCEFLEIQLQQQNAKESAASEKEDEDNNKHLALAESWAHERGFQVLHLSLNSPELCFPSTTGSTSRGMKLNVLVLYDPFYRGGAGADHASIEDLYAPPRAQSELSNDSNENLTQANTTSLETTSTLSSTSPRGKIIVVVGNGNDNLIQLLHVLDRPPLPIDAVADQNVPISESSKSATIISVQPQLYQMAWKLLKVLQPVLQKHENDENKVPNKLANASTVATQQPQKQPVAIHWVGRSLAGGVACIAAAILDGALPTPFDTALELGMRKARAKLGLKSKNWTSTDDSIHVSSNADSTTQLKAWGRGRCSATVLGCPPCISPNLPVPFVTSILLGDDIACRTTFASLERLTARVVRHTGGTTEDSSSSSWWHKVTQPTAALTDALSMTVSSLKTAAAASSAAKDPTRLVVPGHSYLIRPRRLSVDGTGSSSSSIHEVGVWGSSSSRREALRAAVLWQLDDIMLSNSLWKHHRLDSYIHGLDRVQLRSVDE